MGAMLGRNRTWVVVTALAASVFLSGCAGDGEIKQFAAEYRAAKAAHESALEEVGTRTREVQERGTTLSITDVYRWQRDAVRGAQGAFVQLKPPGSVRKETDAVIRLVERRVSVLDALVAALETGDVEESDAQLIALASVLAGWEQVIQALDERLADR